MAAAPSEEKRVKITAYPVAKASLIEPLPVVLVGVRCEVVARPLQDVSARPPQELGAVEEPGRDGRAADAAAAGAVHGVHPGETLGAGEAELVGALQSHRQHRRVQADRADVLVLCGGGLSFGFGLLCGLPALRLGLLRGLLDLRLSLPGGLPLPDVLHGLVSQSSLPLAPPAGYGPYGVLLVGGYVDHVFCDFGHHSHCPCHGRRHDLGSQ